jgi:hypothetical protein
MSSRKKIDLAIIEWRIEPVTLPADQEEACKEDLLFCAEVGNVGGDNDDFESLRRHEGLIIRGYNIVRGAGPTHEIRCYVPWPRLRMRQQRALNNAFDILKQLNAALEPAL